MKGVRKEGKERRVMTWEHMEGGGGIVGKGEKRGGWGGVGGTRAGGAGGKDILEGERGGREG